MEDTAAAMSRRLLPDDVVREILIRVSTDKAALFRCATACKRWRGLVADSSFLLRCWPEGASSLLGFFDLPKGHMQVATGRPLLFIPPPAAGSSVFGAQPRPLASIIRGTAPDGLLDGAVPEVAHGGLLLVRLLRGDYIKSVHLAVCDPLAGTCTVLPTIRCKAERATFSILAGADFPSSKGGQQRERQTSPSNGTPSFKVLAIVGDDLDIDKRKYNLYMFSSTQPRWSRPRKCFRKHGYHVQGRCAAVCHGVARWLVRYLNDENHVHKCYTYDVSAETGHHWLTKLSIPPSQLRIGGFRGAHTLSVDANGLLSLLSIYKKVDIWRLDIWTRQTNVGSDKWLLVKVLDLKPPRPGWDPLRLDMWSGEKSGTLLIQDEYRCVHRINVETRTMVKEQFQNGLSVLAVPVEIDWASLVFISVRLNMSQTTATLQDKDGAM
ncbi:hypothetical protein QYE76_024427 [Lolium multiflorum]|uniref:F-box domain-containing protein n=1 Tax=Lolium multiflorum TaxID=4521 RepID=A0AAD8RDP0_LOLMU|nr:hypothetical protein QYE76_024427 [Lolium multiflorum]